MKNITREIRNYLEMTENANRIKQNLWNTVKVVLRGNLIAINAHKFKKKDLISII